jgi:hypothetical protein
VAQQQICTPNPDIVMRMAACHAEHWRMAPAECSVRSMAHVCSPLAPWFLQVRKLSIYIQRRYILRCGNFLQRPFAYHGKPRERLKSRPPTFPFLLLASGAGIELITPWLRLRRRSRLTNQQSQEIAEVEPSLLHRARGWAPDCVAHLDQHDHDADCRGVRSARPACR